MVGGWAKLAETLRASPFNENLSTDIIKTVLSMNIPLNVQSSGTANNENYANFRKFFANIGTRIFFLHASVKVVISYFYLSMYLFIF